MTVSLVTPDASCDQPFGVVTHDVMCLVKRHAYELAFAVTHAPHAPADEAQPRLHVRMKQPCRAGEFVLALGDVERFYEDLLRMIEYPQSMVELMQLGVRAIISDNPGLLRQAVEEFDADGDGASGDFLDAEGLIDLSQFDAQGHRGGRNLRPENTGGRFARSAGWRFVW